MTSPIGTEVPAVAGPAERPASLWSNAWHDLIRRPLFIIASLMATLLVVAAIWPSLFSSVDFLDAQALDPTRALEPPSAEHWFGTDVQGRDLYAGVIYGVRTSVVIGLATSLAVMFIGGLLGLLSGFYGGWFDMIMARITDIFFAFPLLLGGMLILVMVGEGSIWTVCAALVVVAWPMTYRIARAAVLSAKDQDYVTAARALGASGGRLIFRHVLPNSLAPVIVIFTLNLGLFIAAEAALSFLGIGIQPPQISWGMMIADGSLRFFEAPHWVILPAVFLAFTVLCFVLLGDAVRDALDPKLQ